jgi:antitoxin Phd
MTVLTATELKSRLGEHLEKAQREPVVVKKSGRRYAVIISQEEYERFQALEDRYWSERAMEAEKSGYVGSREATALLRKRAGELGLSLPEAE